MSNRRKIYDLCATRIELGHRQVEDPDGGYGDVITVAVLISVTGGCDPVTIELREAEALALAKAIKRGFKRPAVADA